MLTWLDIAENAYTAFKNYQGLPMPEFKDLSDTIKNAWINACKEAVRTYENSENIR